MTNIAQYIDHTLLKPDAVLADFDRLVKEAEDNKFYSVCVPTYWAGNIEVPKSVKLAVVSGFPHGNANPLSKFDSIIYDQRLQGTVDEVDIVVNIGNIKDHAWKQVEAEFAMARSILRSKVIKYIVEIGYLTDEELYRVADLLISCRIDFIKTCTGYGPRGVTVDDIAKIKKHVGDRIKIKASGGIKTYDFCRQLIEAGADRIGCSNSINILKESSNDGQGIRLEQSTASY